MIREKQSGWKTQGRGNHTRTPLPKNGFGPPPPMIRFPPPRLFTPCHFLDQQLSMPNMTGRPGYRTMEMIGGSSAPYLARTPCVPLFSTSFNRGGKRSAFRLRGAGGGSFPLYGGTFARSYSVSKMGFWKRGNFGVPQFGVGRRGSPRFVPICSDFPFSSDLFRFAFLVCGNIPICSDLFRFALFSSDLFRFGFRTNRNKSGKPLSADPFCKSPIIASNLVFLRLRQRFRKGVGGQRGLAQGNPSHTIDSGLFTAPFSYAPLISRRTAFWGAFCAVLWALLVANPLPPTPFETSDYVHLVLLLVAALREFMFKCDARTDSCSTTQVPKPSHSQSLKSERT